MPGQPFEGPSSVSPIRATRSRPISRLPQEVLAECFAFLVVIDPPRSSHARARPPGTNSVVHIGWMVITHVCNLWRTIALGDPFLWSTPTFTLGQGWLAEILSRADNVPLTIRHDFGGLEMPQNSIATREAISRSIINTIHHHLDHTVAIDLNDFLPPPSPSTLENALSGSAPILEILTINRLAPYRESSVSPIRLGDYAPRLKEVQITHVGGDWIVPAFRGLTKLHVHSDIGTASTSHAHFFELLERCPDLQDLELTFLLAPVPENPLLYDRLIQCPRLHRVEVTGSPSTCALLVNCIATPPTTTFSLFTSSISGTEDDYRALFSALTTKFDNQRPLRSLALQARDSDTNGGTLFEASQKVLRTPDGRPNLIDSIGASMTTCTTAPLTLEITPPTAVANNNSNGIALALARLPFTSVEALYVQNVELEISSVWTTDDALPRMTHVKYLELEDCHLRPPLSSLALLTAPRSSQNVNLPSGVLFPELTHLQINRIDLMRSIDATSTQAAAKNYEGLLLYMVCERQRSVVPIQWICLQGCKISEDALMDLRKAVPTVLVEYPRFIDDDISGFEVYRPIIRRLVLDGVIN